MVKYLNRYINVNVKRKRFEETKNPFRIAGRGCVVLIKSD
jgi:hypothetical protein